MKATLNPCSSLGNQRVSLKGGGIGKDRAWNTEKRHRGLKGLCSVTMRVGLMSLQAADRLGPTQMLKIVPRSSPQIVLDKGGATAAQSVVLEVFPTNTDVRPFFSLGIVSSSVCGRGQRLGVSCLMLWIGVSPSSWKRRGSDEPRVKNISQSLTTSSP